MLTCGLTITFAALVQISQVFYRVGIHQYPKTRRTSWETVIPAMTDITSLASLEISMMDMVWEGPRFILILRKPRGHWRWWCYGPRFNWRVGIKWHNMRMSAIVWVFLHNAIPGICRRRDVRSDNTVGGALARVQFFDVLQAQASNSNQKQWPDSCSRYKMIAMPWLAAVVSFCERKRLFFIMQLFPVNQPWS